jgi:hypothetical protein
MSACPLLAIESKAKEKVFDENAWRSIDGC